MERNEAIELLSGGPKGVAEWNRRRSTAEPIPDLDWASIPMALLDGANLDWVNLVGAQLVNTRLVGASLVGASLVIANLDGANLDGANLLGARLVGARLVGARLVGANLRGADLDGANLRGANLRGASLDGALCVHTVFADTDLSGVKGLDSVRHRGPSTLGTDTLIHSRGKLPEAFLRGCGLPDAWIEYLPSLLGSMQPIQFYSCFISYSSQDEGFAQRLYADLQARGIRCWFAPEDLKIGDQIRDRIEQSIRVHDKLLLVLSARSVASDWIRDEVEAALEQEREQGRSVLFPIRLDDAVMGSSAGWTRMVRRQRHIGDFTGWKDHDAYQRAFARLLRDLRAGESVGGPGRPPG